MSERANEKPSFHEVGQAALDRIAEARVRILCGCASCAFKIEGPAWYADRLLRDHMKKRHTAPAEGGGDMGAPIFHGS